MRHLLLVTSKLFGKLCFFTKSNRIKNRGQRTFFAIIKLIIDPVIEIPTIMLKPFRSFKKLGICKPKTFDLALKKEKAQKNFELSTKT